VESGSGQEIAVNRTTASQIAKLCLGTHGAGYSIEPVRKEEIRQFDFYAKESVGAFRVSDGQATMLLLFVDWRDGGNYYVVGADRRGSPLVEIHEISADRRLLTWRYKPSKRDDRNAERRRYFEEHFGALVARISVPKRKAELLDFLDEFFLLVAQRRQADSLLDDEPMGEGSFPEGRLFERRHLARERSRAVIRLAKERAKAIRGALDCWVCGFDFARFYGPHGDGYIEVHHTVPVSELDEDSDTRVEDLALVCANCHRMLHVRRPWLRMSDLEALVATGPR
jgi:hypothetical protein